MAMEEVHCNRPEIHSFPVKKHFHANVVDLSKKRKLLDTQLNLPIRKQKFEEGSPESEESSLCVGESVADVQKTWTMNVNINTSHYDVEPRSPNSNMVSNSCVEESDCAVSPHNEAKPEPEIQEVCSHDQPGKSKRNFPEPYACEKPSTSFGSCSRNDPKNTLYSQDNRSNKKLRAGAEESTFGDDKHRQFGYDAYSICSNHETAELEEWLDVESESIMLYSNATSSDTFVLSSERWQGSQESQGGTRKPTIDQEFEQYFSMLMF